MLWWKQALSSFFWKIYLESPVSLNICIFSLHQCITVRSSLCGRPFVLLFHFFYILYNDLVVLYFKKSWCILIYHKWYFTCRSNFLKTNNKCTNNKSNKKFTIIMLQIWKVICLYQINGIFRLLCKTKTKKNDFNEFFCATCCALRCATLCSMVNFFLQSSVFCS